MNLARLATHALIACAALAACGEDGGNEAGVVGDDGGTDAEAPLEGAAPPADASVDAPRLAASWSPRPSLPAAQQEVAVVALGGKLYVLGGFAPGEVTTSIVSVFDPATGDWSTAAPLPRPMHHVNAAVAGGKIWVVGALVEAAFGAVGATLAYDPDANAWTPSTTMPAGTERGASMVAAIGDLVYVAGGSRPGASVADFSAFDTRSAVWTALPPLPAARDHGVGLAIEGLFYAIGGRSGAGHTTRVDVFDPLTSTWSSRAPMPTSRAGCAAGVLKGLAVIAGGEGNTASPIGMFDEVEAYDPARDAWSILPAMTTPRHGTGAATIGDVMFVPGGGIRAGHGATAVVESLTIQ